jgi:biotin carboxyl carrier protein
VEAGVKYRVNGKEVEAPRMEAKRLPDGSWLVNDRKVWVARTAAGIEAWCGGRTWRLAPAEEGRRKAGRAHDDIVSPMTGKVRKVVAKVGDKVESGAVLVIVEAMKMEYRVTAPVAGVVKKVAACEGSMVEMGQVLADVE